MDRKKTYTLEEMADHFETVAMFGKSGKPVSMYSVAAAELRRLDELEKFGYLQRTQKQDENGKFIGFEYDVFEQPQKILPFTEKPFTVKPSTDLPSTVNPTQLNTKELNTKELNTKKEIYTKKKTTPKRSGKKKPSSEGSSSFDPNEFFKRAVERGLKKTKGDTDE